MKKLNLLMLLASVLLLFNCRTELTNEEKTDETSAFHSQNNKITFREFLKITQNNEDDLLNSKSGKNSSLNEFDIDTSYILKRTEEANITKFSLLLKKKNETNKHVVYNMLYYRTKSGEWKYFIIKVEHTPNPNKLYGWKKTSLYKLQDGEASKGCSSSYQFGNIDWFQCSAGHGPDCSKNGGACCAGCHHSMAVSYWVNSCDQSASEEFDINYGGGSSNPITMEDVKNAIKNNVSAETYQKFSSLSYNLQQGVISCFYNDYLANDLVSAIIDFFYTHPNTQNPDVIYYRLSDFIKNFTLSQQDWLKNNLNIALPLLDHYTINNNMQFSNWAVNFFIENPNTTWPQFQNWFLTDIPNNFLQQVVLENPATILNYESLPSPSFKMRKIDQLKYPKFTTIIKNLKTEIQNNPTTLNRLVQLTGLTESQVLASLTFGQGTTIKLIPNLMGPSGPNYGNFDHTNPTYINVNLDFVLGLEQASLSTTRHATAFLLAVTVLHEFIHFGNYISGYDPNGNEMGNLFEISTYGIIVTHLNAGNYIIQLK